MPNKLEQYLKDYAGRERKPFPWVVRAACMEFLASRGYDVSGIPNSLGRGTRFDLLRGREQTMRVADLTDEEIALTRRPNRGGKGRRATG